MFLKIEFLLQVVNEKVFELHMKRALNIILSVNKIFSTFGKY
jgi:hypothetical protein